MSVPSKLRGCTIVSAAIKGEVFVASNEDDYTPFSRIWFNPATKGRYGSVCFGHNDLQAQAAVNEHGLFFDFTQQNIDPARFNIQNPYQGDLFMTILGQCKTVKEALAFLLTHPYARSSQALLADAQGNSVIINAGAQVEKQGNFQINTNFDVCNQTTGNYSCQRYDIANELLAQATELSVPFFKNLLSRVHQEGKLSTQYSIIGDLKRGLIYVYNFHEYENSYLIDVKKELKKGYRLQKIAQLFPPSFAYETYAKQSPLYQKEQLLDRIDQAGFEQATQPYLAEKRGHSKKDTALTVAVLEVSLQLVKNAWNQHQHGQMWEYWFSLPGGYQVPHWQDSRLTQAALLLRALMSDPLLDAKTHNFLAEVYAYTQLISGNPGEAIKFYQQASSDADQAYPVSYQRAKTMLSRL
ncbi:carcinine hydrolase/isopenicillin-N N-acyltransferase family protein [Spirosoma pomorum]